MDRKSRKRPAPKLPETEEPNISADLGQSESSDVAEIENYDAWESDSVSSSLELEVEFEGRNIQEQDFDGISQLLHQLFLKSDVLVSELVELILSQPDIGSTIKVCEEIEDEEDGTGEEEQQICGIATVVNLSCHKERECVQKLSSFLLNQCKEHNPDGHAHFGELLKEKGQLGLLINARFLNIPPHVVVPLFKSLSAEIEAACVKGLPYNFDNYLVIARSHQLPLAQQPKKKKKKKKKKKEEEESHVDADGGALVFDHFEYELMQQESTFTFSYPVVEESDSVIGGKWSFDDPAMKPFRTVMVLPASALWKVLTLLEGAL